MEGTDIGTENEPEGMGAIFRWQGAEAQVMVLPGAWRGPGRAPYSRQGREKVEGGMGHVRCYSTFLPYLRRLTLPPNPRLHPISPSTPPGPHTLGSQPSLSLSGRMGSRGGDAGGMNPLLGRAQQREGQGQKCPFPTPSPGLVGRPQPTTIPCPAPARSPPNNNQRKRKRCHLPMPALRVSKPSGMGGARQLLGAWRGGGLPGGGTRDRLPGAPKLT